MANGSRRCTSEATSHISKQSNQQEYDRFIIIECGFPNLGTDLVIGGVHLPLQSIQTWQGV